MDLSYNPYADPEIMDDLRHERMQEIEDELDNHRKGYESMTLGYREKLEEELGELRELLGIL